VDQLDWLKATEHSPRADLLEYLSEICFSLRRAFSNKEGNPCVFTISCRNKNKKQIMHLTMQRYLKLWGQNVASSIVGLSIEMPCVN